MIVDSFGNLSQDPLIMLCIVSIIFLLKCFSGTYEYSEEPVDDGKPIWEDAADYVIRTLMKHPYIDSSKSTVIADFISPIAIESITTGTVDYCHLVDCDSVLFCQGGILQRQECFLLMY